SFPAIEPPASEAMPIKMVRVVRVTPGPNVHLKGLLQHRLEYIPIAIIIKHVRREVPAPQFLRCRLMNNPDQGFQRVFIRVQQQQRSTKASADQRLVSERGHRIERSEE